MPVANGYPAVELHNVTMRYGEDKALDGVDLQVEPGLQVAIVGPNGAGKSTLFNVIAGLLKPQTGTVLIEGERPERQTTIGYVSQRNPIDARFPVTVRDVVMMGRTGQIGLFRWPSRRDRQLVERALAQTEMLHLADAQIGALSGGQQQRVLLARALAQEARLLLLDEPLNGLDVPSQERLIHVLDELRGQQITVLMATHDLNAAAEYADSILLLNRRVIAHGPPRSILTPEVLQNAYGSHLHVFPNDAREPNDTVTLLADTCCSGGEPVNGVAAANLPSPQ